MSEDTRLIKKYPNRRLYDTATSSYITLADVKQLVLDQVLFKVVDAKSEEDLTASCCRSSSRKKAPARRCSHRTCCRKSSASRATPCRE